MSSSAAIPQTFTTMEACMTLAPDTVEEFNKVQEKIGGVVAAQPGFRSVIEGPIANSRWTYFCGKFDTPEHMNDWYDNRRHKPVMDRAHTTWFDAFYIRKWRYPAEGEAVVGPLFLETAIVPEAVLSDDLHAATFASLQASVPTFNPPPFETLIGEFEPQPFQFIGPLNEFPAPHPVRYLLITHWDTEADLDAWLGSSEYAALSALGDVTSQVSVLIRHEAGEREGLNADGSLRSWARPTVDGS